MASDNFARVLALAALDDSELKSLEERVDELARIGFKPLIVEELPTEGMNSHTLYLVPNTGEEENDYDEYLWFEDTGWELMGTTSVDLSDYYTKEEADALLDEKQDELTAGHNIDITNNIISVPIILDTRDDSILTNGKLVFDDYFVEDTAYIIIGKADKFNPGYNGDSSWANTFVWILTTKKYWTGNSVFQTLVPLAGAVGANGGINKQPMFMLYRTQTGQQWQDYSYIDNTYNTWTSNSGDRIPSAYALQSAYLDIQGYLAGRKVLPGIPKSDTAPTENNHLTTKSYVDNAIAGASNVYVLSTMNNTQQNPVILANCKPGIFVGGTDDHTMLYLKLFEEDPNTYGLDLYYGGENCFYYTTDLSQYDYETYTGTVEFGYTLLPVVSPEDGSKVTNGITRYIYYGRDHSVDSAVTKAQQEYVKTSGAQTINGVKTFTSLPESSATPENDNQLVNKLYTDTAVSSAIDDRFFYGTDLEWNELTQEQQDDFLLAVVYPAFVELTPEDQSNLGSIVGSDEPVVSDMTEEDAIAATDEIIGGSNG